jgi:hypothetical protein
VPFRNLETEFNGAGSLAAYIEINSPEHSDSPNMKLASNDEGSAVCQFSTGRRAFRKREPIFERAAEQKLLGRRDTSFRECK